MKLAIISVTEKGRKLALRLQEKLENDSTIIKLDLYHKNVKKNMMKLFDNYDAIIGIMASGILIRNFAPFIVSKLIDPAILNMDENGKFVVSMLSGHMGGANKLTLKIAYLINAEPVITTASDVNNFLGIDVLASDLFFNIKNPENIVHINKAILDNEALIFRVNKNSNFSFVKDYLKNNTLEIDVSFEYDCNIKPTEIEVISSNANLILTKRDFVVGIGCKKGKSMDEIKIAIEKSLNQLNLTLNRIDCLASGEVKKNEKGILNLAEILDVPIYFVEIEKIKLFTSNDISHSKFVKKQFGIPGVCEPSALIIAGFDSELIYKKTAYNGVTIAIAVSKRV